MAFWFFLLSVRGSVPCQELKTELLSLITFHAEKPAPFTHGGERDCRMVFIALEN